MTTLRTVSIGLLGMLLTPAVQLHANDIVDFLRALNGLPEEGHHAARYQPHPLTPFSPFPADGRFHGHEDRTPVSRQPDFQMMPSDTHHHNASWSDRVDLREPRMSRGSGNLRTPSAYRPHGRVGSTPSGHVIVRAGTNAAPYGSYDESFMIPDQGSGQLLPPAQVVPSNPGYPVPLTGPRSRMQVLPEYGGIGPCEMGQFVECPLRLAACVFVEDECNIAPNAVPMAIAVRDPLSCRHGCQERLICVQILVPPCPPQCVSVSPCRTRVSLDYGRYEVDIKTCEDHIVIDYDN